MGLSGLEPPTSRLSGARSNLLSYKPIFPGVIRFLHPALHSLSNVVLVEMMGFEPMTPCLQGRCSPNWATPPLVCLFFTFAMNIEEFDNPSKLNNKRRVRWISSSLVMILYLKSHCLYPGSREFRRNSRCNKRYCVCSFLHRKEVIQPHLPIRLPCYDLTPIIGPTFDSCLLAVSSLASGVPNFHGLTGGVYKARERIHRGMLIRDY